MDISVTLLSNNISDGWKLLSQKKEIEKSQSSRCAADDYIVVVARNREAEPSVTNNTGTHTTQCDVYDTQKDNWISFPNVPFSSWSFRVFFTLGYIYVNDSFHNHLFRIQISAPDEEGWQRIADPIHNRVPPHFVTCGRYAYKIGFDEIRGGYGERYDPLTDEWECLPSPPPGKRFFHSNVVVGNKIYLLGGRAFNFVVLRSVIVFDVSSKTWSEGPELPIPSLSHSAVSIGKWIVLIGGRQEVENNVRQQSDSIYLMNTESQQWQKAVIDLPCAISGHESVVLHRDGTYGPRIAVIGGYKDGHGRSDAILCIDFVRLLLKPNKDGYFSLIEAFENKISWDEGIEGIIKTQSEVAMKPDPKTGLIPFMVAPDIETCFKLLRYHSVGLVEYQIIPQIAKQEEEEPPLKKAKLNE